MQILSDMAVAAPKAQQEPPAALVSDLLQTGTVRPLSPGVKTGRNVLGVFHHLSLGQSVLRQAGLGVDSASDSPEILHTDIRAETGENI